MRPATTRAQAVRRRRVLAAIAAVAAVGGFALLELDQVLPGAVRGAPPDWAWVACLVGAVALIGLAGSLRAAHDELGPAAEGVEADRGDAWAQHVAARTAAAALGAIGVCLLALAALAATGFPALAGWPARWSAAAGVPMCVAARWLARPRWRPPVDLDEPAAGAGER